jgi:hypothetical protein
MVRVPLPFRGVAVLLLAASTVVGQTPEPPAELLSLDAMGPNTPPDFLREFSADTRHPLLSLMVDGELASLDAAPAQDSAKLKPTPKSSATPAKTAPSAGASVQSAPVDGCPDGGLLDGGQGGCLLGDCSGENLCPTMPNLLPFACAPPPCSCHKCRRKCGHSNCGNNGYGWDCGNPYLNFSSCGGCGCRHCRHKHGCGSQGCGYSYGGGYGDGSWGDGCACGGCFVHCEPLRCCCHRGHKHNKGCCGCGGYGGGGWGMGYGGWDGGFCGGCMPPPAPCCHRKCHHKHGCYSGCGYSGYGYPGWGGCGMASVYAACNVPCCEPCKHHCFRRHHRCHGCQQPYPMMTPCMGCDGFGMGGGWGMGYDGSGTGGGWGMGGGFGMGGDGFGMSGDNFVSDGSFADGTGFDSMPTGTIN